MQKSISALVLFCYAFAAFISNAQCAPRRRNTIRLNAVEAYSQSLLREAAGMTPEASTLQVGDIEENEIHDVFQGFIRFSLSSLPQDARVTKAVLKLSENASQRRGNPESLGKLYVEKARREARLNVGSVEPTAQSITSPGKDSRYLADVTAYVRETLEDDAHDDLFLRLRYARLFNNSGEHDLARFRVDGLEIEYDLTSPAPALAAASRVASSNANTLAASPGHIVFKSLRDGNPELYLMSATGGTQTRLTTNPANDSSPALSPDGKRVVWISTRDGNSEVYVMTVVNAAGQITPESASNPAMRLTQTLENEFSPTWLPDGRHIAFTSDRNGGESVFYVKDLEPESGSNPATASALNLVSDPVYNAAGTRLAYTTFPGGDTSQPRNLFVIDVDPTTGLPSGLPQQMSFTNSFDEFTPTWSPDGRQIAFTASNGSSIDNYLLTVVDAGGQLTPEDTSNPTRSLTTAPEVDNDPSWSPDGTLIAFTSQRDSSNQIYVMKPEEEGPGNVPVALTNGTNNSNAAFGQPSDVSNAAPDGVTISLTKTAVANSAFGAPEITSVGQNGTYAYRIDYDINNGSDDPLNSVAVKDLVPLGAQYVSGADATEFDSSHLNPDGSSRARAVFNLGTVDPHSRVFGSSTFVVRATAAVGDTITNPRNDYYVQIGSNRTVGDRDVAVTITTASTPPSVTFSSAVYTVAETGGAATVTVNRTANNSGAISVHYATGDGTAKAPDDYTATSGTLTWTDGDDAPKTFTVPIKEDHLIEGDETVNLVLSAPTGGATLGPADTAVLTITENTSAGSLRFSAGTYAVDENAGTATVTVERSGGSDNAVSVHYFTSDGTAKAPGDYSPTSGTLNWAAGETTSKSFTVPIVSDSEAESKETLNLTLDNPTGGALLGLSAATLTINDDDPHLTVTKSVDKTTVQSGDNLTYTIAYANEGSAAATHVRITDKLPANTTFLSAAATTASGTFLTPGHGIVAPTSSNDNTVTFEVGTVPAGRSGLTATFAVRVNQPNGQVLNGNAAAPYKIVSDQQSVTGSFVTRTTVAPLTPPRFTVDVRPYARDGVTPISTIAPGNEMLYIIAIRNIGTAPAHNVEITDTNPDQTVINTVRFRRFLDGNGDPLAEPAGSRVDLDSSHGIAIYRIPLLPGGATAELYFGVRVLTSATAGSYIVNLHYNAATERGLKVVADDTPLASGANVRTLVVTPFTISKSAVTDTDRTGRTVRPGGRITYTLTYRNTGTSTASDVEVMDTLPQGLEVDRVSRSSILAGGGEISTARPIVITYPIGTLQAGASGSRTFNVLVESDTSVSSISNSRYTIHSGSSTAGGAAVVTTVERPPQLSISKRATAETVAPGGIVTYILTAQNTGGSTAEDVRIIDSLPNFTSFESGFHGTPEAPIAGPRPELSDDGRTVTFDIGDLAPNASRSVTLRVQANYDLRDGSTLVNSNYRVTSGELSVLGRGSVSTRTTGIATNPPVLNIAKRAITDRSQAAGQSRAETVRPGEVLTYILSASNTGRTAAEGVQVFDRIPVGTELVDVLDGGHYDAQRDIVVWSLDTLQAGAGNARTVRLRVRVRATARAGDSVVNSSYFVTSTNLSQPLFGTAVSTRVEATPPPPQFNLNARAVSVASSDATRREISQVRANSTLTYEFSYSNRGSTVAPHPVISVLLPAGTRYSGGSFLNERGEAVQLNGGRIEGPNSDQSDHALFYLPSLQPGQQGRVLLSLVVNEGASGTITLRQTDYAISNLENGAINGAATGSENVAVRIAPPRPFNLYIGAIGPVVAAHGQTITYRLTIGNTGDEPAEDVIVRARINVNAVSYVPNSASDGGEFVDQSTSLKFVIWNFDRLNAGEERSLSFTVKVKQGVLSADTDDIVIFKRGPNPASPLGLKRAFPIHTQIGAPSSGAGTQSSVAANGHAGVARNIGSKNSSSVVPPVREKNVITDFFAGLGNAIQTALNSIGAFFKSSKFSTSTPAGRSFEQDVQTLTVNSVFMTFAGVDYISLKNGVTIIPRGHGMVEVHGPQRLISVGSGASIVATGGGNIVASGAGNLITISGIVASGAGNIVAAGAGNLRADSIVANIVAAGAGNIVATGGGNIVATGGGNLTNYLASIGANIVAAGAGNIVASGAGNIVASGAGNLITNDGGSFVDNSSGQVVPIQLSSLISNDGASLIGRGALAGLSGGEQAQLFTGTGSLISNDGASVVQVNGGNIVSGGAGNIVSGGAGNIVSGGAGN